PQIEYIVVDGGSTDGKVDIIKKYSNRISKWISETDNGIFDALNKGINLSTGNIIGFLHSDDLFTDSNAIEKIAGKFKLKNINAVYSDLVYVRKGNINKIVRFWKAGNFSANSLKFGWMPPHPTLFVKSSLYKEYGLFDIGLKIASDYDMVLRLFKNNPGSIAYIKEVFVKMRLGGRSNRSIKDIFRKSREDYKVLKKNNFTFPAFTLLIKNIRKITQFF
ncbi:MAG TPA: glycosyltransferase family 2 protein, partial [Ignavibacteriaceae bacterium]|nr:glycosyltransferase family 2 protein [Ignavibacteriaceae bacterium]